MIFAKKEWEYWLSDPGYQTCAPQQVTPPYTNEVIPIPDEWFHKIRACSLSTPVRAGFRGKVDYIPSELGWEELSPQILPNIHSIDARRDFEGEVVCNYRRYQKKKDKMNQDFVL